MLAGCSSTGPTEVNRFERRKFVARAPLQHFAIQLYVRLWQMLFKKSPALRDLPW
jgi:hypothetical protein